MGGNNRELAAGAANQPALWERILAKIGFVTEAARLDYEAQAATWQVQAEINRDFLYRDGELDRDQDERLNYLKINRAESATILEEFEELGADHLREAIRVISKSDRMSVLLGGCEQVRDELAASHPANRLDRLRELADVSHQLPPMGRISQRHEPAASRQTAKPPVAERETGDDVLGR